MPDLRGHGRSGILSKPFRHDGGREIERAVDLETLPLFVREGAILPLGPVKQYVNKKVDAPLTVTVYPGTDGEFLLYEDDGISFNYRKGDWIGIQLKWNDSQRTLTIRLAPSCRMRPPLRRNIEVKVGDATKDIEFDGRTLKVQFSQQISLLSITRFAFPRRRET